MWGHLAAGALEDVQESPDGIYSDTEVQATVTGLCIAGIVYSDDPAIVIEDRATACTS